ncbi:hypothetical protein, partial [Thermus sp.]|uniref:hypothetical protein n=1 Tax=Thermus sp. TaxID=275 RepID=UPI0025F5A00B
MSDFLLEVSLKIASYEDLPSQAGRPAGSAKGGSSFEEIVAEGICRILKHLLDSNKGSLRICRVVPRKPGPFPASSKSFAGGILGIENPFLERCLVPFHHRLVQICPSLIID